MRSSRVLAFILAATVSGIAVRGQAQPSPQAWLDTAKTPDVRAELALKAMTQDEKFSLVSGYFAAPGIPKEYVPPQGVRLYSAGYIPGVARLGIPAQWETDAGVGVATQRSSTPRERTALPAGLATAATWDLALAQAGGAMIGNEARLSGFNVMLAGGLDLAREPRNGRNFEYGGEDPLLAGLIVGAQIKGIQSNHIVATTKHYAYNDQETLRSSISVTLPEDQARVSDLLAFELAIEAGDPGSVMCSYNRVDTVFACENAFLLNEVLKRDWGFKGYVMSDWGAVHSTVDAANHGLDQESASSFDRAPYFREPLRKAVAEGQVSQARLDDMVRRILHSLFAQGLVDHPVADEPDRIDYAAHGLVTRADAEASMVLLKNDGAVLPLAKTARRIAIIGGHADVGVLSGGGSAQVYPRGGAAFVTGPKDFPGPELYDPSSPMKAIQARAPGATVTYNDGSDPAAAAKLAAESDVVLVFATQWAAESIDIPFALHGEQDALIEAVAAANPKTIVVLQTGNPVGMPWLGKVDAVLEAWFPGTEGGEAIARVLFGEVNPSGRLPITFQRSDDQLPEADVARGASVTYAEGAAAGYKWFDKRGLEPLFPFGHGLSYTAFAYSNLKASGGDRLTISFVVRNTGKRSGADVAQVYVSPKGGGWEAPKRLGGFAKVTLEPGGEKTVTLTVDPRLLSVFDTRSQSWKRAAGEYDILLGASSRDIKARTSVRLEARALPASYRN
jgi:beta-glucosidase